TISRKSGPEALESQTRVLFRLSTDLALPQEPELETRDRASLVLRWPEDLRRPAGEKDPSAFDPPVRNRLRPMGLWITEIVRCALPRARWVQYCTAIISHSAHTP